jgi:dihydrolipoamide dehydrogenase
VIVIGAGPAGCVAAIRASQLGLQDAVIEKEYVGGVCLNIGCIPLKSLFRNTELAHILNHQTKDFGISFDNLQLDYAAAGRFNFQPNGKALGLNDYVGWAKIITDKKYGEILGDHLIGPEVTELLPELTLA